MTDNLDHANNNSLYSQVGGETAVRAVVTEFYNRVLEDPALAPYFRHKQRKGLEESQVRFFSQALGGPTIYQGPSMADAHKNLHITARNFDRVADHLNETLASLGVDTAHIDAIMNTVAPLKGDIVNENSMDTTSSNSTNSGDTVLRDVDTSKSVTAI